MFRTQKNKNEQIHAGAVPLEPKWLRIIKRSDDDGDDNKSKTDREKYKRLVEPKMHMTIPPAWCM